MQEIRINPMCLVAMTTYHTKNLTHNVGISYGLLYALQEELTYKISLPAPLGINPIKAQDLIERMIQYETLRLRKGKDNMNYYEEFILIGWYAMGAEKYFEQKVFDQLNKAFSQRGAPYSLKYIIGEDTDPKLYKNDTLIKYKLQIDPLQKYCIDALNLQQSKQDTVLTKTLNKEKHLLEIYNEKLLKLRNFLSTSKNQEKKKQVLQVLEMYDRMQLYSNTQKRKTIEAINYSVLTALILTFQSEQK